MGLGAEYEEDPEPRLPGRAGERAAMKLSQDLLVAQMKAGRMRPKKATEGRGGKGSLYHPRMMEGAPSE